MIDPGTGHVLRTLRPETGANALAFAPDGTLATGSWAGIVTLWNPRTGASIGHPTLVAPAPVASIAFDPSGKTFATAAGPSGHAKLWASATLQQVGSDLPGGDGLWGRAAYTPDGRTLFVVFADGSASRWPVTSSAWEAHACAVAGRNLTREEWSRFVTGQPYATTCPGLPSA